MGISDAYVTVTCDHPGCGASERLLCIATARSGYDLRDIEQDLENIGWTMTDDEQAFCEEHSPKKDEE